MNRTQRAALAGLGLLLACSASARPVQDPPAPPPAAEAPLRLIDALRRAVGNNAAIERARAEIEAARAARRGALSLVLPRLQATGGLIRNSEEVSFGSDEDRRTILPLGDWNTRLTLNQPVFAGLREKRTYDQAKEGVRVAESGLVAAEEGVLFRVAREFVSIVESDALIEVEHRSLELATRRLRQAEDFFAAGESTRVDVLRAQSAVKSAERRLASLRRDRGVAAGQLRVDLALDGEIRVEPPQLPLGPPPAEETLLERAAGTRADLRQAESAVRVARLEVQKQQGAYLPVVTADAGLIWQKTTFPTDRYGFAALRFTLPIFQGGEVGARVAQARQREKQARLVLDEARRVVREDVRRALLDAETAATELQLAEQELTAAEAEYAQVFEQYRAQEATSLDAAASEAGLIAARRNVVSGRANRDLAQLQIYYAVGGLASAVLEVKEVQP
ncbi:MAG: TolC family protein [Vicinamibacteria bacterium]